MFRQHRPTDTGGNDCACAIERLIQVSSFHSNEDDCVCFPGLAGKLGFLPAQATRWQAAPAVLVLPLTSEKTLLVNPETGGQVAVFDRTELARFQVFEVSPKLCDDSALVSTWAELGLLTPATSDCACAATEIDSRARQTIPTVLTAWLQLTDRCNLRCDYCYLPHVSEEMSLETGMAAVDAVFRSARANGFGQVKFKYSGGEPLLRFPLILELQRYAQILADEQGLGLEGVVLSNGTLLMPEMVAQMRELGLRLMLSLDGLGAVHDAQRRYVGGRGSFTDVAEAVDLALAGGLTPQISVTVSGRTAAALPETLAWILARDLPFSLNFYRENDFSAGQADLRLDEQKIIAGMLAGFRVLEENLPRRPFLSGLIDRANLAFSHSHTCGVGQNYLVFDQHGRVAKCQMTLGQPLTDVSAADPLAVLRADSLGVQNLPVDEKKGCGECPWKAWCAGGCPLATYRATGQYDSRSPNCRIYQALFPEALRLEGLRLLKYQDDPQVVEKIIV